MQEKTNQKYADIIHLSRPESGRHARMSMIDRGAQFSPFAALVGYEAVIRETARLTEENAELDEAAKEILNRKLAILSAHPQMTATFVCFREDERKEGGSFEPVTGAVKKLDPYRRSVILQDGIELPVDSIRRIEGMEGNGALDTEY